MTEKKNHPCQQRFRRTVGIDYSGAETAEASLKGLRDYQSIGNDASGCSYR